MRMEERIIPIFYFPTMMNRTPFKGYQKMNLVHRSPQGGELWLGDYHAASNHSLLKQKNIKAVLTSAAMLGIQYPHSIGIIHKTIPAFDISSYKMTPHFEEAFRFIDDNLKKGGILVHCAAGISRSTTFVLAYLMRAAGMGFKQAMDYVKAKRAIICPNFGFQNELRMYELTLKSNMKLDKTKKEDNAENQEKKIVLEFISEDKAPTKADVKLSATMAGTVKSMSPYEFLGKMGGGLLRGKSMNYSHKLPGFSIVKNGTNPMSNATKQKLALKLENPKIVTIKK